MCYNPCFMSEETRSLWEIYDSEVPPWRRGRTILICIAFFHFLLQCLLAIGLALSGNLDRIFFFGLAAVLFWLQFYFVWIGVRWLRWLWGAWNIATGFCLIIWAWRDLSAIETFFGSMNMVIGVYLFSPSVYFFAKRQKQTIRWKESLLFAAGCFLIMCNIAAAAVGFWFLFEERRRDACHFADQAGQYIYVSQDRDWAFAHVTRTSFDQNGSERLNYFLDYTSTSLGSVQQISPANGTVRVHFRFPWRFESDAVLASRAESANGPAQLHFILLNSGKRWEIQHLWWDYLPITDVPKTSSP